MKIHNESCGNEGIDSFARRKSYEEKENRFLKM